MRHYYSPIDRQVADPVEPQLSPDAPRSVQRERVPALVDALDCLLALWVAEATLDGGPREAGHPERPPKRGTAPGALGV